MITFSMVVYTILTTIFFFFYNQYSYKNKKDLLKTFGILVISFLVYWSIWNLI